MNELAEDGREEGVTQDAKGGLVSPLGEEELRREASPGAEAESGEGAAPQAPKHANVFVAAEESPVTERGTAVGRAMEVSPQSIPAAGPELDSAPVVQPESELQSPVSTQSAPPPATNGNPPIAPLPITGSTPT